jgi:hypothetical protein
MFNFNVLWTMNLSNTKVLTKWDSKGSHSKRSILVLRLSIYLQNIHKLSLLFDSLKIE